MMVCVGRTTPGSNIVETGLLVSLSVWRGELYFLQPLLTITESCYLDCIRAVLSRNPWT